MFLSDLKVKEIFGDFNYRLIADSVSIEIVGEWVRHNIKPVFIPQLQKLPTYGGICSGNVLFHHKLHKQLQAAFTDVEKAGLIREILFWGGSFNPRFVRGSEELISRHSWGIAFDLNPAQNPLGEKPAPLSTLGTVLRLVPIMTEHGFGWGGDFLRSDAMHFEGNCEI